MHGIADTHYLFRRGTVAPVDRYAGDAVLAGVDQIGEGERVCAPGYSNNWRSRDRPDSLDRLESAA